MSKDRLYPKALACTMCTVAITGIAPAVVLTHDRQGSPRKHFWDSTGQSSFPAVWERQSYFKEGKEGKKEESSAVQT